MNGTAITNRLQNSFKIKDNNLYGSSSYYWNFRTSSFKQVACLILTFADKNNNVSCEGMTYSVILVMMFVSTYKTVNILYTCISFHADFIFLQFFGKMLYYWCVLIIHFLYLCPKSEINFIISLVILFLVRQLEYYKLYRFPAG
jgi:hypothetical protein